MNKYYLKDLINKETPIVLDIGCYDGMDSAEFAKILNTTVYCFEPDPLTQDLFLSIHGDNRRLLLQPFAISDVDGDIEFQQSNHPQSNSILQPKEHLNLFPAIVFDDATTVMSKRLDTWSIPFLENNKIIDLIWADVNGAEEKLIRGGLQTLARTRYLYIECACKELYDGQPYYEPNKQNTFIHEMLPDFRLKMTANWGNSFGNILLVNTKLL